MYLLCCCLLEDFSDYNEDVEEDGGETTIIKGVQGECKDDGEGKYRYVTIYSCIQLSTLSSSCLVHFLFASLHYTPNGRTVSIITDEANIQNAIAVTAEKSKANLIPVFELKEVETSKDAGEGLIVYAQKLSLVDEDYPQCIEGEEKVVDGRVFLRIEGLDETFITTDLMESKS